MESRTAEQTRRTGGASLPAPLFQAGRRLVPVKFPVTEGEEFEIAAGADTVQGDWVRISGASIAPGAPDFWAYAPGLRLGENIGWREATE